MVLPTPVVPTNAVDAGLAAVEPVQLLVAIQAKVVVPTRGGPLSWYTQVVFCAPVVVVRWLVSIGNAVHELEPGA